jgi:hypothetical protein
VGSIGNRGVGALVVCLQRPERASGRWGTEQHRHFEREQQLGEWHEHLWYEHVGEHHLEHERDHQRHFGQQHELRKRHDFKYDELEQRLHHRGLRGRHPLRLVA